MYCNALVLWTLAMQWVGNHMFTCVYACTHTHSKCRRHWLWYKLTFNETSGKEASSRMIYMQYFTSYSLVEILLSPLSSQRNWTLRQSHHFPCFTIGDKWSWDLCRHCSSQLHWVCKAICSLGENTYPEAVMWATALLSQPLGHWVKLCSFSLILPPKSPVFAIFIIPVPKYPAEAIWRLRALFLLFLSRNTACCGRGGGAAEVVLSKAQIHAMGLSTSWRMRKWSQDQKQGPALWSMPPS